MEKLCKMICQLETDLEDQKWAHRKYFLPFAATIGAEEVLISQFFLWLLFGDAPIHDYISLLICWFVSNTHNNTAPITCYTILGIATGWASLGHWLLSATTRWNIVNGHTSGYWLRSPDCLLRCSVLPSISAWSQQNICGGREEIGKTWVGSWEVFSDDSRGCHPWK